MALTGKRVRFVQEYLKEPNATKAATRAGYSERSAYSQGQRLLKNDEVCAAIAKHQEKAAKKVAVTVESLAAELEEARGIALSEKQSSAAVSATMGKAKLFGLGVENRRHSGAVAVVTLTANDLDGLSNDELAALERAYPVLQKLGLVGGDEGAGEEA